MILVALWGCVATLPSDGGGVTVSFPGAHDLAERAVVAGTSLCPDAVAEAEGGALVTECYTFAGDTWDTDARCLTADVAGEVTLRLRPQGCDGYDADTLTVEVVEVERVSASVQWLEELAREPGVLLAEPVPEGLVPDPYDPILVAPGATLVLTPELRDRDDRRVGWSDPGLGVDWAGGGVEAEVVTGRSGVSGQVQVAVEADAYAVLAVSTGAGARWYFATVEAATPPFTLDAVIPAVLVSEDGSSQPLGARAVVRDAAGDIVFGAPVTWRSDVFALGSGVDDGLPSSDYAAVTDNCRDPSTLHGEQTAVLVATLDGIDLAASLVWTPPAAAGDDWTRPAACADADAAAEATGCGCASGGAGPGGAVAGMASLLALSTRRRREGRHRAIHGGVTP